MEKLELTWIGIVSLKKESIEALANDIKGVYRLSYRHDDSNIYVFYAGHSNDIKKSLLHHISPEETNLCIKNHITLKDCFFKYTKVEGDKMDLVYRQICKFYQPGCNSEKIVLGEDIININVN